ncbi:MAG: cupin domain-containing protein [Candidatus Binatia bacterium]
MKKETAKILKIPQALKGLEEISEEIRYKSWFKGKNLMSGLIAFRPRKRSDPKQIRHRDTDVLCHVLQGRGRLRLPGRKISLKPGTICHIPRGTPHDFAAGRSGPMVLFYSLIKTG